MMNLTICIASNDYLCCKTETKTNIEKSTANVFQRECECFSINLGQCLVHELVTVKKHNNLTLDNVNVTVSKSNIC